MPKRGKRSGYRGWVRMSVKHYELYLRRGGQSIGYGKIVQQGDKWFAEIYTDVKGLFSQTARSEPCKCFSDALTWLNSKRKFVSKKLFG